MKPVNKHNYKRALLAAAERLAISRARQDEANMLDRESLNTPLATKNAPTEGVGCMAVLGCVLWYWLSQGIF